MISSKRRRGEKVLIELSIGDVIHLRRFLNRAVDCAQGQCPGTSISAWYYVGPILKKIEQAAEVNYNKCLSI